MVEQKGVISFGHTDPPTECVCVRAWDVSLSTQKTAWSYTIHLKMVAVFWNIVPDFELDFKSPV